MIRDVSFAFHIPAASLLKLFSILPRHDLQSLFAHSGLFVKTVSNALRKLFAILYRLIFLKNRSAVSGENAFLSRRITWKTLFQCQSAHAHQVMVGVRISRAPCERRHTGDCAEEIKAKGLSRADFLFRQKFTQGNRNVYVPAV